MGIFSNDDEKTQERNIDMLHLKNEEASQKRQLAETKAMERQAKRQYGPDWKKVLGYAGKAIGSIHVNQEAMQDLHGMGLGNEKRMRDSNRFRRRVR